MANIQATGATLHQQILNEIENRIVSGEWAPGFRLPFEVDLAESYGVSRMTVNKVLTQLAKAGLIERRKRSGSFVAQPQVQSAILEIHTIAAEVRSMNQAYSFTLQSRSIRKAGPLDRAAIEVSAETRLIQLRCVHFAGDMPFCTEERLINLDTVPEAEEADFSATPAGEWLIAQTPWSAAEHKISAVAADEHVSELLDVPVHTPCLVVQRRTWNGSGPVTSVRFTYPGDKHAIVATFTPASA